MKVAVVGSGPAGWSCARALIERGLTPVMFDAGETLDADRQRRIDAMATEPPERWSAADVRAIGANPTARGRRIPRKLAFGSDYVYGSDRSHSPLDGDAAVIPPSFARGGYSNVWGGAMLPAADRDIADWPIRRRDLAPHYEAILAALPFTGRSDDTLSTKFPTFGTPRGTPDPGPQGRAFLANLDAAAADLEAQGILAGPARLAVRLPKDGAEENAACRPCGLCLTGCPRGAIWATGAEIDRMRRAGTLDYRGGVLVRRVEEAGERVIVHGCDAQSGESFAEAYDAVFLAAGALGTARIMLASIAAYDEIVPLRDSQKFLVPLLRRTAAAGALDAPANVLAAAFLEVFDEGTGHWVHGQVSPHNPLVLQALRLAPGQVFGGLRPVAAPLLRRLMYFWGSAHSRQSGSLTVRLRKDGRGDVLEVRARPSTEFAPLMRRTIERLREVRRLLGAAPLAALARASTPGGAAHYGGAFPMTAAGRARLRSDLLGRPGGFARTYLVDASTFPSIPATTLALTIMANARRIALAAPLSEQPRGDD